MENILGTLGQRYGTDKISSHGYHRFYHDALTQFRDKEINMMACVAKILETIKKQVL